MASIIDGKALAKRIRGELKESVQALVARGVTPGLALVLVGEDPASATYVRNKTRACKRAGIAHLDHLLPATTSQAELMALVQRLNADPAVDGILVQLPLPGGIDADAIINAVDPDKDVDGFHPQNLGRLLSGRAALTACTPMGIMRLLEEADTPLKGAEAVVVGRSNIVGKPVSLLLLQRHCTVTICHSRTRDLPAVIGRADVVIAAVGSPELVKGEWIKPGATVIDVGTNHTESGLVGDVEFEAAAARARAITPVPGGVGPMTIAMLLANTVKVATRRAEAAEG